MKTWLIGIALLVFTVSHTLFTRCMATVHLSDYTIDLWKAYSYTFIFSTTYAFIKTGIKTFLQSQLIEVTFFVVIFTFVITLLTNSFLVLNPYHLMVVVDGGSMATTIMILISATRHGFINKD